MELSPVTTDDASFFGIPQLIIKASAAGFSCTRSAKKAVAVIWIFDLAQIQDYTNITRNESRGRTHEGN